VTRRELDERIARLVEEAKRAGGPEDQARLDAQLTFLTTATLSGDSHLYTIAALNRRLADVVRRLEAVADTEDDEED
jgi:hypothetical protein